MVLTNRRCVPSRSSFNLMPMVDAATLKKCGDELFRKAMYRHAIAVYSLAIEQKPKEAMYFLHRSIAYRQLQNWNAAERDAAKATELLPSSVTATCSRIICLHSLARCRSAIDACDVGLLHQPASNALRRLRSDVMRHQRTESEKSPRSDGPTRSLSSSCAQTEIITETCEDDASLPAIVPTAFGGHGVDELETQQYDVDAAAAAWAECAAMQVNKVCGREEQMTRPPTLKRCCRSARQSKASRSAVLSDARPLRSSLSRLASFAWHMRGRLSTRAANVESQRRQCRHASQGEPSWARFSPAAVNCERCLARTWNKGKGGQCSKARAGSSDFCQQHLAGGRWQTHGRADGPIPAAKLREFLRAQAASSSAASVVLPPIASGGGTCLPAPNQSTIIGAATSPAPGHVSDSKAGQQIPAAPLCRLKLTKCTTATKRKGCCGSGSVAATSSRHRKSTGV